jgi:hypothetical protein
MILENLKILGMTFFGLLTKKKNNFLPENTFLINMFQLELLEFLSHEYHWLTDFVLFVSDNWRFKLKVGHLCELYELIIRHTQAGGYSSVLCF